MIKIWFMLVVGFILVKDWIVQNPEITLSVAVVSILALLY